MFTLLQRRDTKYRKQPTQRSESAAAVAQLRSDLNVSGESEVQQTEPAGFKRSDCRAAGTFRIFREEERQKDEEAQFTALSGFCGRNTGETKLMDFIIKLYFPRIVLVNT